ncbi:hypothetical protein ABZ234_07880 [Nocardiopsis sp. NPDC006198]|uniref:hypothetical protein n=1 Tax=Nocardiopsis sp. NPDC006198 TaxID=3154472 RepID=UPI0033A4F76E
MSRIAQVVAATGAAVADVLRVARGGGSSADDLAIAEAIEKAGGRKAADMMAQADPARAEARAWRAEHARLQRALWEQTAEEDMEFLREKAAEVGITDIEPLLPAISDTPVEDTSRKSRPVMRVPVYSEDTAPDSSNKIAPYHPHGDDEDAVPTREDEAASAHADLAHLLDDTAAAARLAKKWASRIAAVHQAAKQAVQQILLTHPRTSRRAMRRARQVRRMALAA